MLMNASGNYKTTVTVESVLGRPLRANWEDAKRKNPDLERKDRERRAKRET